MRTPNDFWSKNVVWTISDNFEWGRNSWWGEGGGGEGSMSPFPRLWQASGAALGHLSFPLCPLPPWNTQTEVLSSLVPNSEFNVTYKVLPSPVDYSNSKLIQSIPSCSSVSCSFICESPLAIYELRVAWPFDSTSWCQAGVPGSATCAEGMLLLPVPVQLYYIGCWAEHLWKCSYTPGCLLFSTSFSPSNLLVGIANEFRHHLQPFSSTTCNPFPPPLANLLVHWRAALVHHGDSFPERNHLCTSRILLKWPGRC